MVKKAKNRHFDRSLETIKKDLMRTMDRLKAEEFDYFRPSNMRSTSDVMVEFTIRGEDDGLLRAYQYKCNTYSDYRDNLGAIQLTLDRMWRTSEEWKVETTMGHIGILSFLQGFRIPERVSKFLELAAKVEKQKPHEILGLPADALDDEINKRYREIAKEHHPDVGGDEDYFKSVTQARDEMLEVRQ